MWHRSRASAKSQGPTGKPGYLLVSGLLQIQGLHRSTLVESHNVLHRPGTFKSSITIRSQDRVHRAATGAPSHLLPSCMFANAADRSMGLWRASSAPALQLQNTTNSDPCATSTCPCHAQVNRTRKERYSGTLWGTMSQRNCLEVQGNWIEACFSESHVNSFLKWADQSWHYTLLLGGPVLNRTLPADAKEPRASPTHQ